MLNARVLGILLGGALISVWRFSRKKEYAYRMWANVLIAAGTMVIAMVGGRARLGQTAGLYPAEMVASALLLWGFLLAGTLERGARAARSKHERGEDVHAMPQAEVEVPSAEAR
jgi:hypothetical protein